MTRYFFYKLAAVVPLLLAGCLETETIVTVEADGSGTVEQTVYLGRTLTDAEPGAVEVLGEELLAAVRQGAAQQRKQAEEGFSDEELAAARARAEETAEFMGEGVRVVEVEPLPPRDGRRGMRLVYAFADVRQLRLGPTPELDLGTVQYQADFGFAIGTDLHEQPISRPAEDDCLRFQFTQQPTPKLTVQIPDTGWPLSPSDAIVVVDIEAGIPSEAELGEVPQAIQQQWAMMREIWEGARVAFIVKVDGKITQTNATYVNRNRDAIGLLRLNLGEAFRAPEGVKKMKAPRSLEAVEQQLQDPLVAEHIKMETQQQVHIAFE
jgi:hypothetical protein